MVYEPEEDSYLLKEYVNKLARGRVLDVGTGSGMQAIAAAKKKEVKEVVAVDVDSEAVELLKKKKIQKITISQSDLFSEVNGKFDTIIFNPPYLPNDENDADLALDGGEKGHELIARFLLEAKYHLADKGIILLVFSNRTVKKEVDSAIAKKGYVYELLDEKSLPFFEKLYVYEIIKVKK
jgi:release factor glutamine methyltransferase